MLDIDAIWQARVAQPMKTRYSRRQLVWAGTLLLVVLLVLAWGILRFPNLIGIAILAATGFATLLVWLSDQSEWDLIIPPYGCLVAAALVALYEYEFLSATWVQGTSLAAGSLLALLLHLRNPERKGDLKLAIALLAVAFLVVLRAKG